MNTIVYSSFKDRMDDRMREWEAQQRITQEEFRRKGLTRRKSGGIIGAIMALVRKRRLGNKCPNYGATNSKENYACIECGAPLTPVRVEE